mgnify:CR=1 FL=1
MARLKNGILGKASGKIGGIVTGSWKGINYARSYVIPANPKTDSQTAVRGSFATIVFIARAIMLTHIRTYWDNLVKGKQTSGFAKFVGVNQKLISGTTDWENIKLASGSLEGLTSLSLSGSPATEKITATWDQSTATSGDLTDEILITVFDDDKNFVSSNSGTITRDDETGEVDITGLSAFRDYYVYVDVKNSSGDWATTVGQIVRPS